MALNDSLKGQAYMVASCVMFGTAWVFIRYASETMHPALIVFYRNVFGLLALAPFFIRSGMGVYKTDKFNLHATRGISTLTGTYGVFYAVSTTPLATVVGITYAAPIFAAVGAVWLLKEQIHARRVVAIVIGFIGMLMVVHPGNVDWTLGMSSAMLGAMSIAVALLVVKTLAKTDSPQTVVAYSFSLVLPISFAVALYFWKWPSVQELIYVAIIGVGVSIAQIFLSRAFRYADAMAVLPYDFVRLLLATIYGIWLFGEPLDPWVVAGASVIMASTIYTSHREVLAHRQNKLRATDAPS